MLPQPSADRKNINRLKKIAVTASVSVSAGLALIKLAASLYTGSLAVLSSMVDSLSDIFSSLISFIAVKFSSQPASVEHRYGFGKAEALSALVQSAFIAGSGVFVVYEGVSRFISPRPVGDTGVGILVMAASTVITLGLIAFQKYVVKKTASLAVAADSAHYLVDIATSQIGSMKNDLADSAHYLVDIATNLSIMISLIVVRLFEIYWFDTLAALFVSFYLLINAYKIAREAIALLMDKELPEEVRQDIFNLVNNCGFCRGIHDLRTRDLGGVYMFEFHLELDGGLSLYQAHELTDIVENEVKALYPGSQVIIHQDPAGLDEERLDNRLTR